MTFFTRELQDFRDDLHARRTGRPHVFDVVPPSQRLIETIDRHLQAIDELDRWEQLFERKLRGQG